MKIRPIHILSAWFWINFTALCWCFLLDLIGGAVPAVVLFVFFATASITSMSSFETKRGKE